VKPNGWRPRGGWQSRLVHRRAELTTAAGGMHGSIGHNGAQGQEADAKAAEDATCVRGPHARQIRQQGARIWLPPTQWRPDLDAGGASMVRPWRIQHLTNTAMSGRGGG
jgi:hypothetical protein